MQQSRSEFLFSRFHFGGGRVEMSLTCFSPHNRGFSEKHTFTNVLACNTAPIILLPMSTPTSTPKVASVFPKKFISILAGSMPDKEKVCITAEVARIFEHALSHPHHLMLSRLTV